MHNTIICLDIEATGLNPEKEEIIEIAAVKFNLSENTTETFHTLIHTDLEISTTIQNLTGISNKMLEGAPRLEDKKQELIDFCQDYPILGHNIQFDTGFLKEKGIDLPGQEIDTLPLSQAILSKEKSFSLEVLCQKYNTQNLPSHRALDDVLANIELFQFLIQRLNKLPEENLNLLHKTLSKANSSKAKLYLSFIQQNPENKELSIINLETKPSIQKLVVTNTDLLKPSDSYNHTILPRPFSIFNQSELLQAIQKSSPEEIEVNLDLYLKIITKINQNFLSIGNLNHRQNLPLNIKQTLHQSYHFPASEKPYLCDYNTLFYLQNHDQLSQFNEIEVQPDPYLVEGYLQNQELRLNIDYLDHDTNQEINLYRIFDGLQSLLHEHTNDPNSTYKFLVLDMFQKSSPDFQSNLKQLSEISRNQRALETLQQLISNHTNLYIWLEQYQDYPVQIKAIPKITSIDEQEILSTIQHPNISLPEKAISSSTKIVHDSHDVDTRSQQFTDYIIHYLKSNLSNTTHTALVISPTKHIIKQIHEHLSLHFKEQGITLLSQDISGSKGKIIQLLETNESPTILVCTNHFLLKFQPELANLEKAILTKLPIGLPAHKIYRILEKEDDNSFGNLVIPQTAATIRHILNLLQTKYDQKELINLDNRTVNTGWGKQIYSKI